MESDKIGQLRQAIRNTIAYSPPSQPDIKPVSSDQQGKEPEKQNDKRSRCIRIYLTPEEEARILDRCQGIAASIYCRAKVLGESIPRPRRQIPEINRRVYVELSRVSSNLNQITRAINRALSQGQELPLTQEYLQQLGHIEQTLLASYQELMRLANDYQSSIEQEILEELEEIQEGTNAHRESNL